MEFNLSTYQAAAQKENNFAAHIGIEILEMADGHARLKLELLPSHFNPIGSVHGGCIFTMADTVAGIAVFSLGKSCTTLSSHAVFLNAAMQGKSKILYAESRPVRVGSRIAVMEAMVTDDRALEIARFTFEFYVMEGIPKVLEEKLDVDRR